MNEILKDLGFSEREIKVYLALLELGETKVGPIATLTRLQHSKVYETLEKLIEKGLANFIIKSKTKYFSSQDPKELLNIQKEKERKLIELIPELHKKQKFSHDKQIATVYDGYNAIKSLFDSILDSLKKDSYYYVFAFKQEYITSEQASRLLRDVHMRLAEKKIDDKMIANISVRKEIHKNYSGISNIKIKFTDLNLPLGLMIVDNRVINWVWGERPTAIEIISNQIAEKYKQFFLEIWNLAKK